MESSKTSTRFLIKYVFGFTNYTVTYDGRVWSEITQKYLKPQLDKDGYHQINLFKDKKSHTKKLHRLVAFAFVTNPNNYDQINHKDGDKTNNHAKNLEWVTRRQNTLHAYKFNLLKMGESHARSKLSNKERIEIKRLRLQGYSLKSLSQMFSVSLSRISQISNL